MTPIAKRTGSPLEMAINMPANALLLVWMLTLGVSLWRRASSDPP